MTDQPDNHAIDPSLAGGSVLVVAADAALLDEICTVVAQQGIATTTADSTRATLAMLDRCTPSALIVDADLGVGGGFEIARAIRQHPRGVSLPVVLLTEIRWSRTQKQAAVQQMGIVDIISKPVEPEELATIISHLLLSSSPATEPLADPASQLERRQVEREAKQIDQSRRAGEIKLRGSLKTTPFVNLLHTLYNTNVSGALFLLKDNVKKIVYFQEGQPVYVKSNLLSECLGKILVGQRLITEEQCQESLKRMRSTRRQQGAVLIEMGVISPQNLVVGLEQQLQVKLLAVFSWLYGEYLFRQDTPMPLEAIQLPMSNASLIAEGIRSCYSSDRVLAALEPFLDSHLAPATEPQLRFQELHLDEVEQSLRDEIDGMKTLREILVCTPMSDDRARITALILLSCGVVEARDRALRQPDNFEAVDEQPIRARLAADLATLKQQSDPFAVLGVLPSTTKVEIERAYSALAQQSHPDRYRGCSAPTRQLARELFGVFLSAYEQVSSAELRHRYQDQITDRPIGAVPDSDETFLAEHPAQLQKLVDEGAWDEARAQLTRAIDQNDDSADLRAMLGWVIYNSNSRDTRTCREAISHLRRAIELYPRSHRAYLLLGKVYAGVGRYILAEKQFEKALQCDPNSVEALQEIQALRDE